MKRTVKKESCKSIRRILSTMLIFSLVLILFTGCGKENKYVNAGVYLSTDGLSLCLTGYTNSIQSVSNYVYFSDGIESTLGKLNREAQNIDIAYILASDLSKVTSDMKLKVVYADCLNTDGTLRGVWIAREGWLESTPNYSQRYINNLVKCSDYRSRNMQMSYADACVSVKGIRDFDFSKTSDVMQFCAAYALNNDEVLEVNDFISPSAEDLKNMFTDFDRQTGTGYSICRDAYEKYCVGENYKSFAEMFDMSLMNKGIDSFFESEE